MPNKNTEGWRRWAIFSGIALQMGVVIALGVFLGVFLDGKFPNSYSLFTIIFSLVGVFAAMYSVIKQLQKINKDENP